MKPNNVIEINGHLYDAKTGLRVESVKKTIKNAGQSVGKFIDGYRPQPSSAKKSSGPIKQSTAKKEVSKPKAVPKASRTASPNVSHAAKRSTTLNRSAVKKPSKTTALASKPVIESTSIKVSDESRFKRASAVAKSTAISRFQALSNSTNTSTKSDVTPSPKKTIAPKVAAKPAPVHKPESTKDRLIHQALASAPAHQHAHSKKHHKAQHHFGRYVTSVAVVALLVAYVAYLNVPGISMKVAARRAGFAATMPGYRPSGYSLNGPIAYTSGQVTVNYHSNTDDRNYSIKQQPTTWDSTALVENFVAKESPNYLTYQDRGLTIYIFGGSSAAWVNAGKLYNLDGKNSQLDTDQMLKIATNV